MSRYSNEKRAKRAAAGKPSRKGGASQAASAVSDVKQRKEVMNAAIAAADPARFAAGLLGWLEATAYLRAKAAGTAGNKIAFLTAADFTDLKIRTVADDAVFSFCIAAALTGKGAAVDEAAVLLVERYGENYPGIAALACCRQGTSTGNALDDAVGEILKELMAGKSLDPRDVWNAGLRLLEKVRGSNFVKELTDLLAKWHRDRWKHVITQQLFNVTRPRATVPPIEEALNETRNDQCFIAALLIAATEAVDLELDEVYSAHLQGLAKRD